MDAMVPIKEDYSFSKTVEYDFWYPESIELFAWSANSLRKIGKFCMLAFLK